LDVLQRAVGSSRIPKDLQKTVRNNGGVRHLRWGSKSSRPRLCGPNPQGMSGAPIGGRRIANSLLCAMGVGTPDLGR
jgi:hypothetical protein